MDEARCTNPHHGRANPKVYARGLCQSCWTRLRDRGTLEPAQGIYKTCSLPGCDNPHVAKGYCKPHWRAWKKYGDPRLLRPWGRTHCTFPGCTKPHRCNGLCSKHDAQRRRIIQATTALPKVPRISAAPIVEYFESLRRRGWSAGDIAEEIGIDRRNVQRWLSREDKLMNRAAAEDICDALGLHPAMLWSDWVICKHGASECRKCGIGVAA